MTFNSHRVLDLLVQKLPKTENRPLSYDYSFETANDLSADFVKSSMALRKDKRGFLATTDTSVLSSFDALQPDISDDDKLPYEDIMVKYTDKIIKLCEQYNVELIFYRAPYISTENELRKSNWFKDYCQDKGIQYLDLEKEIEFDMSCDFIDYAHLNVSGANRATEFLAQKSTVIAAKTAD